MGRTSLSPAGRRGERDRGVSFPWGRFLRQGRGSGRFLHQHWRRQRSQDRTAIKYYHTWVLMQIRFWMAVPALPPAQLPCPSGIFRIPLLAGGGDATAPGRRAAPAPSCRLRGAAKRDSRSSLSPAIPVSPLAEQLRINWPFDIGGFLPGTIRSCLADGGRRLSLPARPASHSQPTDLPPNTPGAKSCS